MKEKVLLTLAVIADILIFAVLIFNVVGLRKEIELLRDKEHIFETRLEYLEKERNNQYEDTQKLIKQLIPETRNTDTNTNNTVNAESISEDFWKEYDKQVDNLDPIFFVKDFSTYKPKSSDMQLTNREISGIADKGFKESAARIAGEGADNKASEKIEELDEIIPNNYFTRKNKQSNEIYKELKTHGYKVTRTNDMGNGVYVYIDKTTGLIIGGGAFGD